MQIPKRRNENFDRETSDTFMTQDKLDELKEKLNHLKKTIHPRAAIELQRLAAMGDLSDNAAYSIAKGKLRGLNQRIETIEYQIKTATIIATKRTSDRVEVGSRVIIEINGKQYDYTILGSHETRPESGIISHISPLGTALMGKKQGDKISFKTNRGKELDITILKTE